MYVRQNYRVYPTEGQKKVFASWLGHARWTWNHFLRLNIKTYEETGKFVFAYDMSSQLPVLKKAEETAWLAEAPAQSLQQKCQDLDTALKRFFKGTSDFPTFKSKYKDRSGINFPQSWHFNGNRITLPKLKGGLKVKKHVEVVGKAGQLTLMRDAVGDYWVSILYLVADAPAPTDDIQSVVGIDVGLKEFAVTSDAQIIKNPKFYRKAEKKIAKSQREHSRKTKGSNNKNKARIRLAKEHRKVANQRRDFIKQTASSIVKSADLIAVEDLNVKGMIKNHSLAKSIADVSWSAFHTELEWQAKKRGKNFVRVGRFFASSKTCSACGYKHSELTLSDRTYHCQQCGFTMDRDLNAAVNIANEGLRLHEANRAGTAQINACGDMSSDVGNSAQEAVAL